MNKEPMTSDIQSKNWSNFFSRKFGYVVVTSFQPRTSREEFFTKRNNLHIFIDMIIISLTFRPTLIPDERTDTCWIRKLFHRSVSIWMKTWWSLDVKTNKVEEDIASKLVVELNSVKFILNVQGWLYVVHFTFNFNFDVYS